nr:type II toxin-antitoxin system HipA family toxin [uncultured Roseateles sp.]
MATRKVPFKPTQRVDVHVWGKHVGALALDPKLGFYAFAYSPEFIKTGIELSPRQMPLSDEVFVFTELPVATYKRLPALLADALPDDFGNALVNRFMADKGYSAEQVTPLDRLAYMGSRAMGAMQFMPSKGPVRHKPTALDLNALVSVARDAVEGHVDDEDHTNAALRTIIDVGTSAGGARAKAVVAINSETQELRSGQLDAPPGFEHWLLKFDGMGQDKELGAGQDFGRIEYAYFLMARQAGIDMMDCDLLKEGGRAHFITKRFDREGARGRHHMQTLCAMEHLDFKLKGTNSYSQLLLSVERLGLPYEDREEAFRRMVFNVLGRNCDDHTKNFSFLLREGEMAWRLAPAYDVTFAHNPTSEWTHQHLMSVSGKFKGFVMSDLMAEAENFKIGTARKVIAEVQSAIRQWPAFAQQAGLPEAEQQRISDLHLQLK